LKRVEAAIDAIWDTLWSEAGRIVQACDKQPLLDFSRKLLKLFQAAPMKWVDAETPFRNERRAWWRRNTAGKASSRHPEKE
jgi:hypothetical protein